MYLILSLLVTIARYCRPRDIKKIERAIPPLIQLILILIDIEKRINCPQLSNSLDHLSRENFACLRKQFDEKNCMQTKSILCMGWPFEKYCCCCCFSFAGREKVEEKIKWRKRVENISPWLMFHYFSCPGELAEVTGVALFLKPVLP